MSMPSPSGRRRRDRAIAPKSRECEGPILTVADDEMERRPLYLNGRRIGSATTWHEVAELVGEVLDRHITAEEITPHASEGPDGFFIEMRD